jgi:hypothetical protein
LTTNSGKEFDFGSTGNWEAPGHGKVKISAPEAFGMPVGLKYDFDGFEIDHLQFVMNANASEIPQTNTCPTLSKVQKSCESEIAWEVPAAYINEHIVGINDENRNWNILA